MTHTTRIGVGLLCLLAITGVAVGQSAAFTFTTTADEAQPGGETTVTFTFENTGDSTQSAVVNVTSIPAGWEITDRNNDGGQWNSGDQSWLYLSVSPGSSVSPSLTLSVPADADGTYNVSAMASNDDDTIQSSVTFEFGVDSEPTTETATDEMTTDTETMTTDTETMDSDGTEMATDDEMATESEMAANDTADDETATGGSGPGFGVVVTTLAVLCLGFLARRRR